MKKHAFVLFLATCVSIAGCGGGGSDTTSGSSVSERIHQASYAMTTPGGFYETGTVTYNDESGALVVVGNTRSCGDVSPCSLGINTSPYDMGTSGEISDAEFAEFMALLANMFEGLYPGGTFDFSIM